MEDLEAQKIKEQYLKEDSKDIYEIFYLENLTDNPDIVRTKLISKYNDNLLVSHFGIKII